MSSAQLGRHLYPYSWLQVDAIVSKVGQHCEVLNPSQCAWLQAPKTEAWAHLGWPGANATVEAVVKMHTVAWRASSCGGTPPRR